MQLFLVFRDYNLNNQDKEIFIDDYRLRLGSAWFILDNIIYC